MEVLKDNAVLAGAAPLAMSELVLHTRSVLNIVSKMELAQETIESLYSLVEQLLKLAKAQQRKERERQ